MNKRLRQLRKALGMNQEEMAAVLGIGQSTYSQFETGTYAIRPLYIDVLKGKYNVNPDWLTTGEGDMFIKSSKDEEFFAAFESLTDETKDLLIKLILKLQKADRADE